MERDPHQVLEGTRCFATRATHPTSTSAAILSPPPSTGDRRGVRARLPRRRTSRHAATTLESTSTAAPAPTSAARRRAARVARGQRGQPGSGRRSRRSTALYPARRSSTTSRRSSNVPHIIERGARGTRASATEKSTGHELFSRLRQGRARPGNYERRWASRSGELIEDWPAASRTAGTQGGDPGRLSTPFLTGRPTRRAAWTSSPRGGRVAARHGGMIVIDETTTASSTPLRFTRSTRTSRAGSARPAARAPGGSNGSCRGSRGRRGKDLRPPQGRRRQHAVQGVLRPGRRCGLADRLLAQVLPGEYEEHVRLGRCPLGHARRGPSRRPAARPGAIFARRRSWPWGRCSDERGPRPARPVTLTIDGTRSPCRREP